MTEHDLGHYAQRLIAAVIDRPNHFADGPTDTAMRKAKDAMELLQFHGFELTYCEQLNRSIRDRGTDVTRD